LPVYIASRKKSEIRASQYSKEQILDTLRKRPLTLEDIEVLFDEKSQKNFNMLLEEEKINPVETNGIKFYKKA
jgi:hypothetical protein